MAVPWLQGAIVFDIETAAQIVGEAPTGKDQIVSLSYKIGEGEVQTLYAQISPEVRAAAHPRIQERVLGPLEAEIAQKKAARLSEQDLIKQFAAVLEAHPNAPLVGHNIGYEFKPFGQTKFGFDLPQLASRSAIYGYEGEVKKALGNRQIVDVGAEYSYRIASALHTSNIDPRRGGKAADVLGSASPYAMHQSAREAATSGRKFRGWTLGYLYERLFGQEAPGAHLSSHDVLPTYALAQRLGEENPLRGWTPEQHIIDVTDKEKGLWWKHHKAGIGYGIEEEAESILKQQVRAQETKVKSLFSEIIHKPPKHLLFAALAGMAGWYIFKPVSLFSAKKDEYNTIEGLPHGGWGEKSRRQNSDFGSGWLGLQDDDPIEDIPFVAGIGYGGWKLSTWAILGDTLRAPGKGEDRLAKLREAGSRGLMFGMGPEESKALSEGGIFRKLIETGGLPWREGFPETFQGLIIPRTDVVGGFQDIPGAYIANREFSDLSKVGQLRTMVGAGLADKIPSSFHMQGESVGSLADWLLQTKATTREEIEKVFAARPAGSEQDAVENLLRAGQHNIVVKGAEGAKGQAVWIGKEGVDLPEELIKGYLDKPENYLLQEKLKLSSEYRVFMVGEEVIASVYRFGSPGVQKIAHSLGIEQTKDLLNKKEKVSWVHTLLEGSQPVPTIEERAPLESFAKNLSSKLPYEITAFDIGKTEAGAFKLLEVQREFGHIYNPLIRARLKAAVTGQVPIEAKVMAGAGAGLILTAAYLANWITSPKEEKNTIEGLRHGGWAEVSRKGLTDFGSGWDAIKGFLKFGDEFQQSLLHATFVKELGRGAQGVVNEMKGIFRGQEFSFARKTYKPIPPILKDVLADPRKEGEVLADLTRREFKYSPTLYAQREGEIDIELLKPVARQNFGLEVERQGQDTVLAELHRHGYSHGDPRSGNLVKVETPEGPSWALLDFGLAKKISREGVAHDMGDLAIARMRDKKTVALKKIKMAQAQNEAARTNFENGISGGKRHTRY